MGNVLKGARAAPIGCVYAPAGTRTAAFPGLLSSRCEPAQRPVTSGWGSVVLSGREEHDVTPPVKKKIRLIVHERVLYFRPDFSNFIKRIKL